MKKLIILFNLGGSYKGGAQKRYLRLFSYLQANNYNDYYLLLNKSLYDSVFYDKILHSSKNVNSISIQFEHNKSLNQSRDNNKKKSNPAKSYYIKYKKNVIVVFLWKFKFFLKSALSVLVYSIKLCRYLKSNNFDSVYCVYQGGIWSELCLKFLNVSYKYSYNDTNFGLVNKGVINIFRSEYFTLKNAAYIDCLSPYIARGLMNRFPEFDKSKLLVTPNSFIDYENYFPAKQKENWISFCSRFEILKNPYLLIEAIILIKDKIGDYKVKIIGYGDEYVRLNDAILKHQLQNIVELCGAMDTSVAILSRSKIFVSVQQDNNYPSQSLLEAMACGNAIVASDVGETRLLVTENEGILIPLDARALANAILQLINNEEKINTLAKMARHKVTTEHTIEKFVNYFINMMWK